jgi:hypothetical protein
VIGGKGFMRTVNAMGWALGAPVIGVRFASRLRLSRFMVISLYVTQDEPYGLQRMEPSLKRFILRAMVSIGIGSVCAVPNVAAIGSQARSERTP